MPSFNTHRPKNVLPLRETRSIEKEKTHGIGLMARLILFEEREKTCSPNKDERIVPPGRGRGIGTCEIFFFFFTFPRSSSSRERVLGNIGIGKRNRYGIDAIYKNYTPLLFVRKYFPSITHTNRRLLIRKMSAFIELDISNINELFRISEAFAF